MMKYLLALCLLLMGLHEAIAQGALKIRAELFDYKTLQNDGTYTAWYGDKSTDVLIVVSGEEQKITIYNETKQVLDIYDASDVEQTEELMKASWQVVDQDGDEAKVIIELYKGNANYMRVYVIYETFIVCYSGHKLE